MANRVGRASGLLLLIALLVGCGQTQQHQDPNGQTALPSAQLQSESAPPGVVPAPGTQQP